MKCGRWSRAERIARIVVVGGLVAGGLLAYVRKLAASEEPPALYGLGLVIAALNVLMILLLAVGMRLSRAEDARWRPASILATAGAVAASLAFYGIEPEFGASLIVAMIALWVLVSQLPLIWGFAAGAVTIGAAAGIGRLFRDEGADLGVLVAAMGITLGAIASRQGMAAQEAARRAEAANAVLAERSHLAREIHDILAHSLSAQVVHLEGARLLLSRDGDRVQALDRVERARNLARSGLEETRRALATLRGEIPQPTEVIAELAEEFHASTGRSCDVHVTGEPRDLPPQAGLTVVRTAQEALTNIRKHAPGARAHVTLRYLGDKVELEVTDTGGTEPVVELDGGGYGLVGMRERAELIDGTLVTGPDGKGFRVSLRVPV
ncbi:sensor histidine kinase [Actinomadura sp. KC345]|uniref:sensor histidine kinase n=1 Tax=Actinomadura sp. KC345 TaxID=2530371 RepID=UPI00104CD067|nr:sensor histidine kinase [Actinomadura sp. KC345]TDC53179.1 sensor histidine kinase [Actinomadura sp. KC345]